VSELLVGLLGALFGAGVAWGLLKGEAQSLRKDLNGLGTKERDFEARTNRRQANVVAALLASCPQEKRIEIAHLLKD
jgi:hypothetical protein